MLSKTEVYNCMTTLDNQDNLTYRYILTEHFQNLVINDEEITISCYGVEIISEKTSCGELVDVYSENIDCIGSSKGNALNVIKLLSDFQVSPVHLVDVAGSIADEVSENFENECEYMLKAQ